MCQATSKIATEKVGARIYVTGNTFAVKDRLKQAGCHWDGDRKQWWIGVAKADAIAAIIGGIASEPAAKPDLADSRIYAQVEYKGRKYYVIAEGQDRCRLTVLDGSLDFWADMAACSLIKTYQPRTLRVGFRGRTETVYTTLGSIRSFIAQRRDDEATLKSGEIPDGWCLDHEDGMIKPRSECDMPAE